MTYFLLLEQRKAHHIKGQNLKYKNPYKEQYDQNVNKIVFISKWHLKKVSNLPKATICHSKKKVSNLACYMQPLQQIFALTGLCHLNQNVFICATLSKLYETKPNNHEYGASNMASEVKKYSQFLLFVKSEITNVRNAVEFTVKWDNEQ